MLRDVHHHPQYIPLHDNAHRNMLWLCPHCYGTGGQPLHYLKLNVSARPRPLWLDLLRNAVEVQGSGILVYDKSRVRLASMLYLWGSCMLCYSLGVWTDWWIVWQCFMLDWRVKSQDGLVELGAGREREEDWEMELFARMRQVDSAVYNFNCTSKYDRTDRKTSHSLQQQRALHISYQAL